MRQEIWIDKYGKKIPVRKMTRDHIRKALKHFLKKRTLWKSRMWDWYGPDQTDVENRIAMLKKELLRRDIPLSILQEKEND